MRKLAIATLLVSLAAFGQEPPPDAGSEPPLSDFVREGQKWAGWSFQEENDVLSRTNTDKSYTQGLRFTLTRNPQENPPRIDAFAEWFLRTFHNVEAEHVWSIGLGQSIYTPDDITISTRQLNDRHWAGFLYIDNTLQLIDPDEKFRHVLELQTGLIGPGSGARWAQATIHEIIDSAPPVGWPNQLRNEPGVNLIYSHDRRIAREIGPLDADLLPFAGGSLGTVMTYANAGAVVRVGKNNTGFLNGAMRASAYTNFSGERPRWEFWVYGGAEGRAVAHNIYLSGGFFKQVPSEIDTKRFVYDLTTGFSLRYRRWRLTYNFVRRSNEYSHPFAANDGSQEFGSVMLSVEPILPRR
jgi:lipid A 3-O-deacylase